MKVRNLIHILIGIVCVGLLPGSKAVGPLPDGDNTAGQNALLSLTTDVPFTPTGDVQQAWVARHDGPDNYDDEAKAVAVDGSGNVYVTGFTFDPNTDYDYTTIKYNSAGQQQWVARYDGPENYSDKAAAIAVDASGNVYITGASSSNAGGLDYATIKYNSAGQQQWVARYDGPVGDSDQPTAIAVDGSGSVYVTGKSYGSGYSYDYTTIKYNAAGQQQWVARYDGPGNYTDQPTAIAVDGSGSVYVTGASYGSYSSDYATIKYNSAGQQQWVARYDGPTNSDDEATAIAIDGVGNIYVTGYSLGSVGDDYATIKYNSTGQQQWVRRYDGPSHSDDEAIAIAIDGAGFIYVTGFSGGNGDDYATIKYNSAGQQQWVARYDGPVGYSDQATAIAVDGSGSVYVTGRSYGSGYSYDYATIKYNSAGQQQWVVRYDGPGGYSDQPTAIAVDGSGSVYVTGASYGSGSDYDYATIKYSPTGPPVVATSAATNVASFSATLRGTVYPDALTTTVYFQYGTTTSYGLTTASQIKTGNTYQNVSANISPLSANTTYHFRIVATNSAGTRYGIDRTFTTSTATGPPIVTTNPATNVATSSAKLNGSVDPHGLTTRVYFQYGPNYGHSTPMQSQTGNTFRNINADINGLSRHTTYHFRIVATNSVGTRYGSDRTFTTQ